MNTHVAAQNPAAATVAPRRFLERPALPAFLLGLITCVPIYYALHRWPHLNDDSFITLTFSKNLAAGRGFVYNHGDPTFGSTTPLLVIVGAALKLALPSLPLHLSVTVFTALCLGGVGWVFFLFRKTFSLSAWTAFLVGASVILTCSPFWLGMEVYLFQFLLVLACALAFSKHCGASGFVIGLLYMTRGEGSLLLPCLMTAVGATAFLEEERDRRKLLDPLIRMALGAACVAMVWTTYAYLTFGRITPNTLSAKQASMTFSSMTFFTKSMAFGKGWINGLQYRLHLWGDGFGVPHVLPWLFLFLTAVGFYDAVRHRRQWLVFVMYILVYIAGYSLLVVEYFKWYSLSIIFVLTLLMALGLSSVARWLSTTKRMPSIPAYALTVLLVSLVVLPEAYRQSKSLAWNWKDERAPTYLKVCRWLRENTEPVSSVSFAEVGYLGYFTDNQIIDTAGLVTPDIIPWLARNDPVTGFWKHKPDYHIWIQGDPIWSRIVNHRNFDNSYKVAARIVGPEPRAVMFIYERREE